MKPPVSTAGVAALVLAAAPLVLLYLAGWSAPTMPSNSELRAWLHQPLTTGFLTTLLQASAWLLWAMLATTVTRHLHRVVAARLRWRIALRVPGPMQGLAAALLGATAVTSAALPAAAHATSTTDTPLDITPRDDAQPATNRSTPSRTVADGASAADTGRPAGDDGLNVTAAGHDPSVLTGASASAHGTPSMTRPADSRADRTSSAPAYTCVVRDGDTLSAIAQQWLGDPDRWPEIWELNRGTRFGTVGGTFTDPDLIYPGWTLDLPTDAVPPAATPPAPAAEPEPDPPRTQKPPAPATPDGSDTPPSPAHDPAAKTTSAPSDSAATPSDQGTGTPPATSPSAESGSPEGITLGTGSWLDLGLAAAIAAAASLVWARRRRRYQPLPAGVHSRSGDPDLTPMPAIVTRVRRALRQPTTETTDDLDIDDITGPVKTRPEDELPAIDDTAEDSRATGPDPADGPEPYPPVPVVPAQDNALGEVWPPAGLGLTGPGADAAGRGFLCAALAAGNSNDPTSRSQVIIPAATMASLLGAAVVLPATARLTITAGLDDALEILETQTLRRSRLVYQHEVDTLADLHRTAEHEQPQPPILLIAHAAARHERTRIAALLTQGQRLDIHGILLGPWPDGDTVTVDSDGTTSRPADGPTRHGSHPADLGRLAVLTPTETIDLITTLAEAHTGERPASTPAPPTTPQPAPNAIGDADHTDQHEPNDPDKPTPAGDKLPPMPADTPTPDTLPPGTHTRHHPQDGPRSDDLPPRRVTVRTLGDARIVDMDTTVPLRAKSLELLVYLIVHDGDATADAILDDLLPDAPRSKAPHRLHTYVSALRKTLTRTGGPASYLTHPGRRYTLNRETLDVDLWRMRTALRDAERATDATTRLTALRTAVAVYRGNLAEGFDYEWIEVHRESIRRQALDAHLALADETRDPAEAVIVLEAAIRHAPYTEAVYQQAMRAHAALGHHNEIHALRHTLTRRLEEIDATPSRDTTDLADQLTASPPRRPAAAPRDGRGRR
ncbi:BTAD domain-containing putative transcriptional regulator [Micromonospora sp. NPDC047134]|uniref:BTAD domain-containing putative transcriptional regulator n=1 Tax=Micromonospora sp. NPDC047134 TaxID=3154340 RepID=UPI0033F64F21